MEQEHYLDNDFFIPENYQLFHIKKTTLGTLPIPARTLPYSSNNANVHDLLSIFLEAYNIKSRRVDGKRVMLGMENVGKLPLEVSVFELKSRLNHVSANILEFQPLLPDQQVSGLECFKDIKYSQSPQYKPPEAGGGKLQICVQLPQIDKQFNCQMAATDTLEEEVAKALKQNEQRIGRNLLGMSYKAICPVCKEQAKLDDKIYALFHTHQLIELWFDQLAQERPKKQPVSIELEIMEGTERLIKIVSFSSVTLKRVKTVLQECGLDNAHKLSLRVMGVVLKPGDLFLRVEKQVNLKSKGRVPANILEESELFYTMGVQLLQINFDLQEVAARYNRENVIKLINQKREQRITEISELPRFRGQPKQLRESSFLDPILSYTSKHFYQELNQFLRDTDLASNPQKGQDRIEYKFSFAIVRSLLMLPGYTGLTYRGATFLDKQAKKGKILCYKSFFSSSQNPRRAQAFGRRTYYTIKSLTGREISNFSYYQTQTEVLFMPYTYFHVTDINQTQYGLAVTLQEIPMPRRINSNLLMWVDDDPSEGSKILQDLQLNYPRLTTQFIQLTSNDHLKAWLKKFGRWAQERSKVSLITDLRRMQVLDAGLETIRIMRRSLGNKLNIYIYTFNLPFALNLLEKNHEKLSDSLAIGKHPKEVKQFIIEKVLEEEELSNETCQLI